MSCNIRPVLPGKSYWPCRCRPTTRARNLGFHLPRDGQRTILAEIVCFAAKCRELLLPRGGDMLFTDMDRLDGVSGSVDILVASSPSENVGTIRRREIGDGVELKTIAFSAKYLPVI